MEEGNAFLPGFAERFNARFATAAARPANFHLPLNLSADRPADILAWREHRHVGRQLAFSYRRQRIILYYGDLARPAVGRYVDTHEFADGRLDVRFKGVSPAYRTFDKDQRATCGDRREQAAGRGADVGQGALGRADAGDGEERQRAGRIFEDRSQAAGPSQTWRGAAGQG